MISKKFFFKHSSTPVVTYNILVLAKPSSTYGSTTGSGTYSAGSQVQISATANQGYSFVLWTDSGTPITNPLRTITVNGNAEYTAQFVEIPTSPLRIVDENLNLYSYTEYDALVTKPNVIGVAILDGSDWLVCYKSYINGSSGLKLRPAYNETPAALYENTLDNLLILSSGLSNSNVYANDNTSGAAYQASLILAGGLTWYLPNVWELTQIFERALDTTSGSLDGFDSHFSLIQNDDATAATILKTNPAHYSTHAHWTCDGNPSNHHPWRIFITSTGLISYWHTGDYTYCSDPNFVRPVARIPINNS